MYHDPLWTCVTFFCLWLLDSYIDGSEAGAYVQVAHPQSVVLEPSVGGGPQPAYRCVPVSIQSRTVFRQDPKPAWVSVTEVEEKEEEKRFARFTFCYWGQIIVFLKYFGACFKV